MRSIIAVVLGLTFVLASWVAYADVSAYRAKSHISQRLQYSSRVADKLRPFQVRLGGKKGDLVRPFAASNIRQMIVPTGGPGSVVLGGIRIHIGNRVTGTLNMKNGKVRVLSVASPR